MKHLKLTAQIICIGLLAWYMYMGLYCVIEVHDLVLFDGKYGIESNICSNWLVLSWTAWFVIEAIVLLGILWVGIHLIFCLIAIAFGQWDFAKHVWENRIKNIK